MGDCDFLLLLLLLDGLVGDIQFYIVEVLLLVVEVVQEIGDLVLVFLEEDADGEDESFSVSLHEALEDMVELLLRVKLSILFEDGDLQQNLAESSPVILFLQFSFALVLIVYVFFRLGDPVLEFDVLFVSDDDVGWGDGAVDDIVGMDELYALDDWYKRIEDLFL